MADSIRGTLIDTLGRPIGSALVKVYVAGGALASIYSDKALSTPITNDGLTSPLSEVDGSYGPFYVANGRYDIIPSKVGSVFDSTDLADIEVEDVREQAMTITAAHTFTAVVVHQGAESFTGVPGFNPGVATAPFTLNANGQGQLVTGLRAATAVLADTATVGNSLAMTGEAGANVTTDTYAELNLGTVSTGDRIFVSAQIIDVTSVIYTSCYGSIIQSAGAAVVDFVKSQPALKVPMVAVGLNFEGNASGVIQVTTGGTLTIRFTVTHSGGTPSTYSRSIYAFFLKKA